MIIAPNGQILQSNQPNDILFGYDIGHLAGRRMSDVLSIKTVAELNGYIAAPSVCTIIEGLTGTTATGDTLLLRAHVTAWTDADNGIYHALLLSDIDEERDAERVSRVELERANNAIKGARIAIWDFNCVTNTVAVCDLWREILEICSYDSAVIQEAWRARLHPDDEIRLMEGLQRVREGKCHRYEDEYRLRSKDDTHWIWFQSDLAIVERDHDGTVTRISGAMSDITDRKMTEEALRRSVERFRSSFESSAVGMALVGIDGRFLQVNSALCTLLGYSDAALLEMDFQSISHPDDLEHDLAQLDLLKSRKIGSYQMEKRYVRTDGAIMWGLLSVGLVTDDEGRPDHFVSQFVDVTEQHRLNQLKSDFVSTISHELRTPLTSILGSLMLLSSMDDPPFSEQAQRLLYIAQQNGNRLHVLINDLLDFEKFSAGKMRFERSRHRIADLLEDAVLANMASSEKYGVTFNLVSPDFKASCLVDAERFQQVMTNLLSNAAKFSRAGSVIDVGVEERETNSRITVVNQGEPIPESFRDEIFEPFIQVDPTSTRARGGTGLGLAITKQIVEQAGGKIGFDSTQDGRTTFWFSLPCALSTDD
ncbi:PAS domain-containing sensor histidine kinase [Oceaniglobus ichthyenteri]|uniref:PAS domain-containing sensor histidine kinase n=1 Tax=Oceaniglobus ichthyenteri TaxID=2136177 RepID=UPI0013DDE215|nr:PAS domain-containing sensor histidine kinase [Oceaniglobus ichthyenteri]